MTQEEIKNKATKLAKTKLFSHDISHCNPELLEPQCAECKRYVAHIQFTTKEKYSDSLASYLSKPDLICISKEFKFKLNF